MRLRSSTNLRKLVSFNMSLLRAAALGRSRLTWPSTPFLYNPLSKFRFPSFSIRSFSGSNADGDKAPPLGVPTPASFDESSSNEINNVIDLNEEDLPPLKEMPETMRDSLKHAVVPEFLPVRDALYADRPMDYFLLADHRITIKPAYDLWQQGKLEEALQQLENADDRDPSVVLALAQIFKQQGLLEEAKQV